MDWVTFHAGHGLRHRLKGFDSQAWPASGYSDGLACGSTSGYDGSMGAAGKGVAKSSLPIEWALASGLGIAAQKKLKRSGCDKTQKVNAAESQQRI